MICPFCNLITTYDYFDGIIFYCKNCSNCNVDVKFTIYNDDNNNKHYCINFYIGKQLPLLPWYRLRLDFYHNTTYIHLKDNYNLIMTEVLILPYIVKNVTPQNCLRKLKTLIVFS